MGYVGSRHDAAHAVGRTGDGGIDGIIKEDRLGLDAVYVQAKRWGAVVGRPVVQAFSGSLDGARARKGVLITTSTFSADAHDYVRQIEKRIVLVDGRALVDLMIEHEVGVTTARTYDVKRVDSDYFDEE
jgi:restriction system protein